MSRPSLEASSKDNKTAPGERAAAVWWRRVFLLYVAVMLMLFLLPVPFAQAETRHLDKVVHFGIFLGFALLFWIDRQPGPLWTFLVSATFAGTIELAQRMLPYRHGDWMDFAVGALGAGVGVLSLLWAKGRHEERGG
ncbi:MAG TPA: VanZ family protein [Gemmatimonadales bacterium]|nr:VanZ family protein [Gemmatimonadales bacterium]